MGRQWKFTMASGKVAVVKGLDEEYVSARHWSVGETRIVPKRTTLYDADYQVLEPDDVFWYVVVTPEGWYIGHFRSFEDCKSLYERSLRDKIVEIEEITDGTH